MGRLFSSAITIPTAHIFYESRLSFAFVNHKPVLPGHVLVAPKRVESSFSNLKEDEMTDLMVTVQKVNLCVLSKFNGHSGLTNQIAHSRLRSMMSAFVLNFKLLIFIILFLTTRYKLEKHQQFLFKMELLRVRQFHMFTFTSYRGVLAILRRMMKFIQS